MKNKFFKEIIFIIISGLLINLFCVFLFFFSSHAAGNENDTYFPMEQNYNLKFRSDDLEVINNYFDMNNKDILIVFSDYRDLGYAHMTWFWVYQITRENDGFPKTFGEIYSNGYQFSIYETSEYAPTVARYCWDSYSQYMSVTQNGSLSTLQGLDSSLYNSNVDYVSNFKIYTSSNTNNRGVVLKYGADEPEPVPTGEARKPFFNHNPEYSINDQAPTQVPESPTINNYTWNTYNNPPIDNTNELTLLESIWDSITYNFVYLKDGIHGEIYTLIGNLTLYFDYIGDTISYYGDLIIGNIQDFANNFYENMAALVQPILDSVNAISNPEPVDTEAVNEVIAETSIYGLVTLGDSLYDEFSDFFDDIEEVHTLRFTIPYTILDYTDYVVLDFSWYDDIRSTILPWIVGFLYAGFGLALFRSIPSIIHGVSGILQKGG